MTAREVVLEGGSPWGFRIHGGVDVQQPIRIARVNPGSKSSAKGIREGDVITTINNKSTAEVTNSEAHSILKKSGNILLLGLNESPRTTSKKFQASKTVEVGTTEDRTQITTNTTTIAIRRNDSHDATHQFSPIKINRVCDKKESLENVTKSQASTLSSTCSSSPSTASVYSDLGGTGIYNSITAARNNRRTKPLISPDNVTTTTNIMSDKLENSSRIPSKKRTRVNTFNQVVSNNTDHDSDMKPSSHKNTILERFQTLEYRVDSPETVNKKPKLGQTRKSRSLDDDEDDVVITELSEISENEESCIECGVVIEDGAKLSHQDEQKLRTYLGGLKLATPSCESYKERKARTRAALAEHFLPVLQQPRFLDVISEECSDSSCENQNEPRRRKRSCVNTEREIVQVRGGALEETESVQGITWKTVAPQTDNAEVVYLDAESGDDSGPEDFYQLTPPPTPDCDDHAKTFPTNFVHDPEPLRGLCVKKLLTLPFGRDVLEELADVSENIQDLTKNWQERHLVTLHQLRKYGSSETLKEKPHEFNNLLLAAFQESQASAYRTLEFDKIAQYCDEPTMPQQDNFERQLEHIREKEREIQIEIEKLEEEKRKVLNDMAATPRNREFDASEYYISKKGDYAIHNDEAFRQKMYEEYMSKIAAIHERKLHKIIKITSPQQVAGSTENLCEVTHPPDIENEFMCKVRERMRKFGLCGSEEREVSSEDDGDTTPVLVIDGDLLKDGKELPKHIQELLELTERAADGDGDGELTHGVWSPGQKHITETKSIDYEQRPSRQDGPIPPIWTPRSAGSSPTAERKEFKPVSFDSPVLGRKSKVEVPPSSSEIRPPELPRQSNLTSTGVGVSLSSTLDKRLPTSHSAPASGFSEFSTPRLPKAQNPTITLLQKAREGQLPKGASYLHHTDSNHSFQNPYDNRPPTKVPSEVFYQPQNEYGNYFDSDRHHIRMTTEVRPKRYEFNIGPTGTDGMPLGLRSEVKEANQSKWYRKMYDTIHKQKPDRENLTVRYKQRRARYPYVSGYFSEPEHVPANFSAYYYDSDGGTASDNKYSTLDRRRVQSTSDSKPNSFSDNYMSSTLPTRPRNRENESSYNNVVTRHSQDVYRNHPGRIENYVPGHSSISEKEAKEWWDEVMDIFDGHLDQQKKNQPQQPKSFINQALKESGYESDSNLIFKRREESVQQPSPTEQKEAYKSIQKGGDVPLHGLRKLAPEKPKEREAPTPPPKGHQGLGAFEPESPRKYVENEVTIHYKTPVRQEVKESVSEEELSRMQAEHMKRVYEDERRRKYLQVSDSVNNNELQDITSRRHTDNFIPSQKSPISLTRYDDFIAEEPPRIKHRPKSPEPRLIARALFNFVGQSSRELTFRKGDIIYIRRQVDKNWYEGEHNAMIGLFPSNYVEIIPFDGAKSTPRKPYEGQARAKFNFIAQTNLELSLAKGELVVIIRRVDDNWYEGRIGGRKGIFPVSYIEVLIDPATPPPTNATTKPVSSPAAHSMLLNGSAGGKESMGSHNYTPSVPYHQHFSSSYRSRPQQVNGTSYGSLSKSTPSLKNPMNQALHIDTHSDPIPYRALYKYRPQNEDELELLEGDVVYVLEKCDDGWYVGSSQRTGAFGTFPGNYVERV